MGQFFVCSVFNGYSGSIGMAHKLLEELWVVVQLVAVKQVRLVYWYIIVGFS